MKLFNLNRKNKKGFTLIEILLVVGFIAIAGIGIYTVYAKVTMNNAANTESRNIDTMRAGVKNLLAGASNTSALPAAGNGGNTLLNQANITPTPMTTAGTITAITNSFGGAVLVNKVTLVAGDDGFRITYPSVPGAVCTKLVTGTGSQFEQVTIVGAPVPIVKPLGTNSQVNIADATAGCATDTGTGVTIHFDSLK